MAVGSVRARAADAYVGWRLQRTVRCATRNGQQAAARATRRAARECACVVLPYGVSLCAHPYVDLMHHCAQ